MYSPANPENVTDDMQPLLNDWTAKMCQLIRSFENNQEGFDDRATSFGCESLVHTTLWP